MKLESSANQPKMLRRIQLRYALGLLAVAILLFAWFFLKKLITSGVDYGHTDTAGWIVAVRQTGSGEQAVALKPDNTVLDSPGYRDGAMDQDVVWQPDGDRIYFSSDRDPQGKSLQIYRWNPAKDEVDQRSSGKLAQERPTFQEDGTIIGEPTMLVIKAGVVVEFNPNDGTAHQRVPVETNTPTQASGDEAVGMGTQFGPEYDHLGSSFREAHWCKNRKYIAGIMRGDDGETLVVICTEPGSGSPLDDGLPHGLVKGEHIDMSVDPKSGNIACTVNNFQFVDPKQIPPQMIKGGKVILPFRNLLGYLNLDEFKGLMPLVASKSAEQVFAEPQISPDGTQIAFVAGADTPNGFVAKGIALAPIAVGGARSVNELIGGSVSEPTWSPDGKQIAYVASNPDGHGDIAVIPATGGKPTVMTSGKGSFNSPHFSPALPKAGS